MRWRGFLAAVAVCAAVAAVGVSPALAATTWTVDPAGNDILCPVTHVCQTIQQAVNLAAPGDTINVHKGLYNENVTINKRLTLNGATRPALVSNCITTAASPAFDTVVDGGGGLFAFDIEADRVSVKGFVFQNATLGVVVDTSANGLYSGFTIKQNLLQVTTYAIGETTNGAFPSLVQQNCFRSNNYAVFSPNGPNDNIQITGNKSRSNLSYAYALQGTTSSGLALSGNISTSDGVFLLLLRATNFTVSGNIANSPTTGASLEHAAMYFGGNSNGTISGNILSKGTEKGILFDNVFWGTSPNTNLSISGNVVSTFPGNGLEATASSLKNSSLSGNITKVTGVEGLRLGGGNFGNSFAGNIFQGKTWGCHSFAAAAMNNWNGNSNIGKPMNTPGTCFP
jgi:nitrous oxidase accessory protein NosD